MVCLEVVKVAEGQLDAFLLFNAEAGGFDALLYPGRWQAERACQLVYGNTLSVVRVKMEGQVLVVEQAPEIISRHIGEVPGLKRDSPGDLNKLAPECSELLSTSGCLMHVFAVLRYGDMVEVDSEALKLIGILVAAHGQTMTRRNRPGTQFC